MALLVSSVSPAGLGGSVGLVDGLGQPTGELAGMVLSGRGELAVGLVSRPGWSGRQSWSCWRAWSSNGRAASVRGDKYRRSKPVVRVGDIGRVEKHLSIIPSAFAST